jgi:4-aminobutyrate aminotransferase-like enzyme
MGLLVGVELCLPDGAPATKVALAALKRLLHRGFILLPEGEAANVLSFTPPLAISEAQLQSTVTALAEALTPT